MYVRNDQAEGKIPLTKEAFPNYTLEMWRGNCPAGKGHTYVHEDGSFSGIADRWETRFGGGESLNGKIMNATFSLNYKVSIFVIGKTVIVNDIRYAGKCDFWQYSNDDNYRTQGVRHELEAEKLHEYITATVEDCKLWQMIQERLKELIPEIFD